MNYHRKPTRYRYVKQNARQGDIMLRVDQRRVVERVCNGARLQGVGGGEDIPVVERKGKEP